MKRIPPKGWTRFFHPDVSRRSQDYIRRLVEKYQTASLAVACGYNDLASVDIDTDEEEIVGTILMALPVCRIAKRGSKGHTLFFRFAGDLDEMCNRLFYRKKADGTKADAPFLEILWTGRKTTIPPSLHAKLNRPYQWLNADATLFNTRAEDLPVITMADIEALETALEPWLYEPPPPPEETGKPLVHPSTDIDEKRFRGVARSMLDRLAGELRGKTAGRNIALYSASRQLGKYVEHRYIDESDVVRGACLRLQS